MDELTLELRLPEPVAHIPYLFAQLPFFPWPRHKLEELGEEWHAEPSSSATARSRSLEANEKRVVFTRNPHWPSSTSTSPSSRSTSTIPSSHATNGKRGASTSSSSRRWLSTTFPGGAILRSSALSTEYIGFSDQPPFDDVRVRRALAHGLDRAPLIQATAERSRARRSSAPGMPGHSHDLAPAYDSIARESLLAEAGIPTVEACPSFGSFRPTPVSARTSAATPTRSGSLNGASSAYVSAGVGRLRRAAARGRGRPVVLGLGLGERLPRSRRNARDLPRVHAVHTTPSCRGCSRRPARSAPATSVWSSIARPTAGSLPRSVRVVPTIYDNWFLIHRPHVDGLWTHPMGIGPLDEVIVRRPGATIGSS